MNNGYPNLRRMANVYSANPENSKNLPEMRRAAEAAETALRGVMDRRTYLKIEPLLNAAWAQEQEQGFIYGFRYAVRLMQEVFCDVL